MSKVSFLLLMLTICSCTVLAQKQSTKLFANKKSNTKTNIVEKKITIKTSSTKKTATKNIGTSKKPIVLKVSPKKITKKSVLKTPKKYILKTEPKKIISKNKGAIVSKVQPKNALEKKPTIQSKNIVEKKKKAVNTIKEKLIAKTKKNTTIDNSKANAIKIIKNKTVVKKTIKKQEKQKQIVKVPKVKIIPLPTLELNYPFQNIDSSTFIKHHFGKVKINESSVYYNEGLTFETTLDNIVYCNVDTAIITDVLLDDDSVYTVFFKKDDYTIVLHNLSFVQVVPGDTVILNQQLGIVAIDEMQPKIANLELMLFRNNKVLNPEKFIKPKQIHFNK